MDACNFAGRIMFYCGTSGFSYDDWVGIFYPRNLPRKEWLNYYAREFNALELNSTFYTLLRPQVIASLANKTGKGFKFAVKANREMTHLRQQDASRFKAFINMLQPLIVADKLGCVLAQFPYSFGFNPENREYLKRFYSWMGGIPLVVEFRNSGWLNPQTFDWMRNQDIGFCCVDEPRLPRLVPPVAEVTSNIGYVRFHGRNAQKWWQHEHAWERYDYTYSRDELEEWMPKINLMAKKARDIFIFANNHWHGQAIDTIRQVRSMLDQLVL